MYVKRVIHMHYVLRTFILSIFFISSISGAVNTERGTLLRGSYNETCAENIRCAIHQFILNSNQLSLNDNKKIFRDVCLANIQGINSPTILYIQRPTPLGWALKLCIVPAVGIYYYPVAHH